MISDVEFGFNPTARLRAVEAKRKGKTDCLIKQAKGFGPKRV